MDTSHGASVRLSYKKLRDISTPEEESNGASTYFAVVPAIEVLKVGTSGNLRSYIPAHPGKKRSMVHKAIGNTIRTKADRFSQYNSGLLIGTSRVKVDDAKKEITLWDASINNGAQTQGEIKFYIDECMEQEEQPNDFNVRVEISVEPDVLQRTEIAIARNSATRIQDISQAGKRGYFDELDVAFQKVYPNGKLAKSETDLDDEFIDTRLLLQVLWALLPQELMPAGRTSIESRMRAYKNAAQCLSDFQEIWHNRTVGDDRRRYAYFCDMAGQAWSLYQKLQRHSGWRYLRQDAKQVKRKTGAIIVADGIIFPMLAAYSNFVKHDGTRWSLSVPSVFKDEDLLEAATRQLRQLQGKPMLMGRSGQAYESLMLLTEMANRYAPGD